MKEVEPAGPFSQKKAAPSWLRYVLAWGVHFYTALGLVLAGAMALLIVRGGAGNYAGAFVLMFVAVLIDASDGMLARAVRVKEVLPGFDGTLLDNLIDFLTFTFLPLLLLWRAAVVPDSLSWCLLPPLLASAYGFCQVDAKTADGYFRGFPSYWNIVALYLYLLQPPLGAIVGLLWVLAFLTFIPSLYLYPTRRGGTLEVLTNVLGAVWGIQLIWILVELIVPGGPGEEGGPSGWLVLSSLGFPAFYLTASWAITLRRWFKGHL